MRLLPLYLPILMVGILVASRLRREPAVVLRVAAAGALVLAVFLAALAVTGWPVWRSRQRQAQAMPPPEPRIHRRLAHLSVPLVVFATPTLIAAALCHRRSRARRNAHVLAAAAVMLGWYVTAVTGYLLPGRIPAARAAIAAATLLRFALLHMFAGPALLALLLLAIAWRHARLTALVSRTHSRSNGLKLDGSTALDRRSTVHDASPW